MANGLNIRVNGKVHRVKASPNTPLLYVLRNELQLNGPRYGCGLAQCGSCSVLHNGKEIRSCITPVAAIAKGEITTLEGLAATWKGTKTTAEGRELHPVQQAWIDEQVPQCGYCQNGMMIKAAELLSITPRPTIAQIKSHMNTHLCRCGTYPRITKAVQRASRLMTREA
jgi:aerobic-type carbon monoxide dehydrogenase small subunit (CoxS/CutS family)